MRYPEFIKDGGTIGFVAPSFGCATEPYLSGFKMALSKFERMGYKLDLGPNCTENKGIGISNTPKLCGQELNEYYPSSKNDAIISCGGGELMCEVIPYMDFDAIKNATPKWYMGFSDNTNFTFLETTICDTASIYGPCAGSFGMEDWHESLKDAFEVFTGKKSRVHNYDMWERNSLRDEEHPYIGFNLTEKIDMKCFVPNEEININDSSTNLGIGTWNMIKSDETSLEGRLIGGCLDCLLGIAGTRFDYVDSFNEKYKEDGIIWFLEACDLNIMSIRRGLGQLKNTGWFKYVKGFLVGRPCAAFGEEAFGIDQYRAVIDVLGEYNVPILMDLDIGHLSPMMPIVCGSTANVTYKNNEFEIEYTWK